MKKQFYIAAAAFLPVLIGQQASAQSKIKDGTVSSTSSLANANAVLDLESNNKGFLLPRIALSATNLTSPMSGHVAGMVVYNTATAGSGSTAVSPGYYYDDGTQWVRVSAKGDILLSNTALTSTTAPAGTVTGEMRYNTNAGSGVPVGPVYWDGTKWVSDAPGATQSITLTSASAPAGTSVGQVAYNTSNVQPTGLVYWDGSQWKAVNSATSVVLTSSTAPAGSSVGQTMYNTGSVEPKGLVYWDGSKWVSASTPNSLALVSSTSPAGTSTGEMRYNTNAGSGVPVGPVYWDGTKWVSDAAGVNPSVALTSSTSPAGTTTGQMAYNTSPVTGPPAIPAGPVYWDGSAWQPVGADAAVGNEVLNATTNKGLTRAGSGTAASPYTLGLTDGTAANQTMIWDGTKWTPGQGGLVNTALTSTTTPAGSTTGEMRYNTSAASGLPVGPVYWDGSKWVSSNQPPSVSLTSATTPAGASVGQTAYNTSATAPTGLIYWDGTTWQPVGGDPVVGNEVTNATGNKGLTRAGSGTTASPYTLGLTDGTAANQTMIWDGTKWTPGQGGLVNTALTSTTTPAGSTTGEMRYNTSAASGVPVGPVYWDGSKWVSSNQPPSVSLTSATTPAGASVGQTAYNTSATSPTGLIYWDGSTWQPVGGDPTVGNEVNNATTNKGLTRAGSGTTASPYTLGLTDGTAANQTMVWDGTKWTPGQGGLVNTALTSSTTPAGAATGEMRYNTSAAGGVPVGPVYWNGSSWQPVGSASEPWFNVATTAAATSNTQDVYQMGKVGVNIATPSNQLHVNAASDPLRLQGLQSGSFTTDSVLVATSTGVVRRAALNAAPDQTVGTVAAFAYSSIPSDYLECNGAAVSRTTYATLFAKIGTTYGVGNGSTTFNLPDLRGEFIRGWDHSRGIDASRTLGSFQGDAIRNISGWVDGINNYAGAGGALAISNNSSGLLLTGAGTGYHGINFDASTQVPTAADNRPRNVAMVYAIKAKESVMLPTGQSVTSLITANEPWYSTATSTGATSNTENIYQMGQVMVGTTTVPTGGTNAKLIVNSAANGAVQIKDGTQGVGKKLICDANGLASWAGGTIVNSSWAFSTDYTVSTVGGGSTLCATLNLPSAGTYFVQFSIPVSVSSAPSATNLNAYVNTTSSLSTGASTITTSTIFNDQVPVSAGNFQIRSSFMYTTSGATTLYLISFCSNNNIKYWAPGNANPYLFTNFTAFQL